MLFINPFILVAQTGSILVINFITMKRILLSIATTLAFFNLNAQNYQWANHTPSSGGEFIKGIVTQPIHKDIFVTGYFDGSGNFSNGGPTLTSNGSNDIYIQKYNKVGGHFWTYQFGSAGDDRGEDVELTMSGRMIVVGTFNNTVDFDIHNQNTYNLTSNGNADIFIVKLLYNGTLDWAKSIGGLENDAVTDVEIDENDNIYITGSFQDSIDLDPGTGVQMRYATSSSTDTYILKLDKDGNYVWGHSFDVPGDFDAGLSIEYDGNGNIFLAGYFGGLMDFDPGTGTHQMSNTHQAEGYILKLDTSASFQWTKIFSDQYWQSAECVTSDANGNVYVSGYYSFGIDLNPSGGGAQHGNNGNFDCFVVKFDSGGNYKWGKTFGSNGDDRAWSNIKIDANGNLVIGGIFSSSTIDFDPNATTYPVNNLGSFDGFILSLDTANGAFSDIFHLAATADDRLGTFAIDDAGDWVVGGYFKNTMDFDLGAGVDTLASEAGSWDSYLAKYSFTTTALPEINEEKNIVLYPNPAQNQVFILGENPSSISIYNTIGKLVGQYYNTSNIDVGGLAKGYYILNINVDGKIHSKKLIKE